MVGEMTSRNHQAYSSGLVVSYVNNATVFVFASSLIILLQQFQSLSKSSSFFLKIEKTQ